MPLIQAKQVNKYITGRVHVISAAVGDTTSAYDITLTLTAALATASDQGTAVPLQVYTANTQPGLIVTPPKNRCEVFDSLTKRKLQDQDGNEVYGVLSLLGPIWQVNIFRDIPGVGATAFAIDAGLAIDVVVPYVFDFYTLPVDFATSLKTAYVNDDPTAPARYSREVLTVTALNTLSVLANNYSGGDAELNINGQIVSIASPSAPFSIAGTIVTWSSINAGFALETTDEVIIKYTY